MEQINSVISFIALCVAILFAIKKGKAWEAKYKEYKLNQAQVRDNIKNMRRYDWGTGREYNWRHTWNAANPVQHKWLECISIIIKSVIVMFSTWFLLAVISILGIMILQA